MDRGISLERLQAEIDRVTYHGLVLPRWKSHSRHLYQIVMSRSLKPFVGICHERRSGWGSVLDRLVDDPVNSLAPPRFGDFIARQTIE